MKQEQIFVWEKQIRLKKQNLELEQNFNQIEFISCDCCFPTTMATKQTEYNFANKKTNLQREDEKRNVVFHILKNVNMTQKGNFNAKIEMGNIH